MGLFSSFRKEVSEAGALSGGGVYIGEGSHVFEIVKWFGKETRKKGPGLFVDLKVVSSTNPTHVVGSIRNNMVLLNDEMGPAKARAIVAAASGSDSPDSNVSAEELFEILELSITKPIFIGHTIACEAPRVLSAAAKKLLKADASLADDPKWFLKNSYVRLDFSSTPETRAKVAFAKAPVSTKGTK